MRKLINFSGLNHAYRLCYRAAQFSALYVKYLNFLLLKRKSWQTSFHVPHNTTHWKFWLSSVRFRVNSKLGVLFTKTVDILLHWSMTYLAWGRQGLFQIFFKVVLHKRHCCWPTTYFLPFFSLLMNIIFWKFEATQTWGRRNMLRLLKTASGS